MRNLLLNSILIILILTACSVSKFSSYDFREWESDTHPFASVFPDEAGTYKFKSEINLFDNYLTGILVVKKDGEDSLSAILLTEIGLKIFDLSISRNSYSVNYALEQIRNNDIFELIARNINLLFTNFHKNVKFRYYSDTVNNRFITTSNINGRDIYHYFKKGTSLLEKIESTEGNDIEITVIIKYSADNSPVSILIENQEYDINLSLFLLEDYE